MSHFHTSLIRKTFLMASLVAIGAAAAVPSPEKLLPEDTLAVLAAPNFSKLAEVFNRSPQCQFLEDPAMKPFRDKFVNKWNEDIVKPLERELGIRVEDYTSLLQGQLTLAITQNGWQGKDDQTPGILVLLDARDKSDQLKTNLTGLRKRWVDSGHKLRTERIRDIEFAILPISTNDLPKTIRQFFPADQPVQELGKETPVKSGSDSKEELVIGQVDSLLIVANSTKVAEKVVVHLTGGSLPALGDSPLFQPDYLSLFREAPAYGWINASALITVLGRSLEAAKDADSADTVGIKPDKVLSATGLSGLKTLAFASQSTPEGSLVRFFLGVPESGRTGLFKILAGEPKESTPPGFVPADAVKFQRVRIDGQKAWATLEKMLSDISPQSQNAISFLLDTVNSAAKEKDPDFDVRKSLIGNLGDDIITYEKAPKSASGEAKAASIFLLGSPRPEQFAATFKNILVFLSAQAGSPTQREFLGRKIFTVPMPALPIPGADASKSVPQSLSYAASGGYVAFSSEPAMIEEFLRSAETPPKPLREIPGLAEATQKVAGPGTALLGYDNQAETMRAAFEMLRKSASDGGAGLNAIPGLAQIANAQKSIREWVDFSLLPPFDKVSRYFSFSVYGGRASSSGLTLTMFSPVPPGLQGVGGSKPAETPAPAPDTAPPKPAPPAATPK